MSSTSVWAPASTSGDWLKRVGQGTGLPGSRRITFISAAPADARVTGSVIATSVRTDAALRIGCR